MSMVYLVLGLALIGGIFWTLTQVTARQRRLQDELTRLERLAAEVALSAEAILDRVDDRTERLQALLASVEAAAAAAVDEQAPPPATEQEPAPKKRGGRRKKDQTPAEPVAEAAAAQELPPASIERYQALRTRVLELSDAGKELGEIAQLVGVPRGEVQLMLNLRTRKVTA